MCSAVEVVQNSFREFSLSGSEKNPFSVKSWPVRVLPGHRKMDHIPLQQKPLKLRFMEMFVETIAASPADSTLLTCNF